MFRVEVSVVPFDDGSPFSVQAPSSSGHLELEWLQTTAKSILESRSHKSYAVLLSHAPMFYGGHGNKHDIRDHYKTKGEVEFLYRDLQDIYMRLRSQK